MTKVAIITVDYNGHDDTQDFLESAKKLNTENLEILKLVVDNGSDESVAKTVSRYSDVTWMQTGKNLGFAGGFNKGLKYAKEWGADYFLVINNDTLFSDNDLIKKLLKVFSSHQNVGIVSPKINFAPGYEFFKDRYSEDKKGNVIWYAGGTFDWDNVRSIHLGIDQVDSGQYDKIEKTDFISGCCFLVKREVLEKVGYFEEKLFAYYEDSDWLERVKRSGYESWYCGSTFIYHKVSRTSEIGSSFTDYLITRNRLWFGMKYASLKTKFALLREAVKFILIGRQAQKEGVFDYFYGVWGWKDVKQQKNVEYPLKLSIIAINYKTTNLTLNLLKSIYDVRKDIEIIILDNSPDDPCKKEVLSKYPNIKFISNKENNGFAAGNNQMINYSLGENILLLNSDIEVKHGAIDDILNAVKRYGNNAIYSGKLLFPDGKIQDSCFMLPTAWHAFEEYFLKRKGKYFMFFPEGDGVKKVEGAVMACFLIPQKVINEIGILQEETFMYFEDIEYCRRARENNIPVYYVPTAEFIHYHGQSSKKAGVDLSTQRLIKASKWYHGPINYFLVTAVLWLGQKWGKVTTPVSRWEKGK